MLGVPSCDGSLNFGQEDGGLASNIAFCGFMFLFCVYGGQHDQRSHCQNCQQK